MTHQHLTLTHCLFVSLHTHTFIRRCPRTLPPLPSLPSPSVATMRQSRFIQEEYSKKYAVKVLRTKLGHENTHKFEQCDKNECGAYLQYKKQPKDKAMSKDLIGRRERCGEWITRPSPTASPNQSDDVENYAADAVEGLLGMAAIGGLRTDMLEGNGVEGGVDEDDNEYGW